MKEYHGVYHVLNGYINPSKGIGFDGEVLTVPDAKFEERFSIDESCTDSFALRYSIEDLPVKIFKK